MNSFGTTTRKFQLVDPRDVRTNRVRFRRDAIVSLERANSFYCPVGRFPSRGWILLPRFDYDELDHYSTSLELELGSLLLKNVSIVQARCVTRGLEGDDAIYLVELTDDRGVLWNRWFQAPTLSVYNVRSPAYPNTFYGTTYTWSTMVQDLWTQMPTLGAYPGLPTVPTGTPENWYFHGTPAWTALCDVLDSLGMSVACDLTLDSPFTIVNSGAADAAFSALQTKYLPNLEDDMEWLDVGAGRVPAIVYVLFRRRYEYYGTEETVRSDAFQWTLDPFYSVAVAAPAFFNGATGKHFLLDTFTVRRDYSGTNNAADVATAATIAAERVTQYFGRVYSATDGFLSQTYTGALPFTTGSQVDGVCWAQDYYDQKRQGWKTYIVRGESPPWPGVWDAWFSTTTRTAPDPA